jgi:hypothetical protein
MLRTTTNAGLRDSVLDRTHDAARIRHLVYANLLLISMLYISLSVCQNYAVNACLWLLNGILFRLPRLALDLESSHLAESLVYGRRR